MHRLLASLLFIFITIIKSSAVDYYVKASGGLTSGLGSVPANALDFAYALTNQSFVYTLGTDRIIMMGGTYTGYFTSAGGNTNSFDFRVDHIGTPGVNGWLEIMPYYDDDVIIDIREFQFTKAGQRFWDITFTDSTRSTKNAVSFGALQTADIPQNQQFINCHFVNLSGSAPNNCLTVIGCFNSFVGTEFHEHGLYAQSTDPLFTPIIKNNLVYAQAGEAIKFINGGYNVQCFSNVFINSGRYTAPVGPNSVIIHQIGNNFTNANNVHFYRNYCLDNKADSTSGGVNPMLWWQNGSADSLNLWVHDNIVHGPDTTLVQFGNGANQGTNMYGMIYKSNRFEGPISNNYFVRIGDGSPKPTADWNYNNWIGSGAPSSVFQWAKDSGGSSTLSSDLAGWTNSTSGGPNGHWDINATYTTNTGSTLGGDVFDVLPDPITVGRGHIVALNNTGQTSHNFDLTSLGLLDGQPYVLIYAGSYANRAKWVTNTFVSASPNLSITLTDAAWPIEPYRLDGQGAAGYTSLVASNSLPEIGAWLVIPSPLPPTLTVTPSGDRTSRSISWAGSQRWGKVRLQRRVDNGAWTDIGIITKPQVSTSDSALTPASKYDYRITAINGFAEGMNQTVLDSGSVTVTSNATGARLGIQPTPLIVPIE